MTCMKYTYSHKEGGLGGDLNQREGRGPTVHKATVSPVHKL